MRQREILSLWPFQTKLHGFELHHGQSIPINKNMILLTEDPSLGWILNDSTKGFIAGTYIHGIFYNYSTVSSLNQYNHKQYLNLVTIIIQSQIQ